MLKVGITGLMGSGKSYISSIFSSLGIPIYNSDERARWVNNNIPELREKITKEFGDVYTDGILDRKKLKNIVFITGGEYQLGKLNRLVHPYVFKDFINFCDENSDSPFILAESALLFESNMTNYLDKIIFVDVPYDIRLDRTIKRDSIDKDEYDNRMRNQISSDEKIKRSDFVIDNSTYESKVEVVKNIYNILVNK